MYNLNNMPIFLTLIVWVKTKWLAGALYCCFKNKTNEHGYILYSWTNNTYNDIWRWNKCISGAIFFCEVFQAANRLQIFNYINNCYT